MNLDNLNKWLTLLANIGVVAGIVFLAIEVRQNQISLDRNSELMEREYELQVADGLIGIAQSSNVFRYLLAENGELAQIWSDGAAGRELSVIDHQRFMSLCGAAIWGGATQYGRNVTLGRHDLAEAEANVRRQMNSQPGLKQCWEENVGGLRLWGYGDLVDAVSNSGSN